MASFQPGAGKIKVVLALWLLCQSFLLCRAWAGEMSSQVPRSQLGGQEHRHADHAAHQAVGSTHGVLVEKATGDPASQSGPAALSGLDGPFGDNATGQSGHHEGNGVSADCCDGKHDYIPSVFLSTMVIALSSFFLLWGILFRLRARHRFYFSNLSSLLHNYPRTHLVHCTFLN